MATAPDILNELRLVQNTAYRNLAMLNIDKSTIKSKIEIEQQVIRDGVTDSDSPLENSLYQTALTRLPQLEAELDINSQNLIAEQAAYSSATRDIINFVDQDKVNKIEDARQAKADADAAQSADPTSTVKSPENTNTDKTAEAADAKQESAEIVGSNSEQVLAEDGSLSTSRRNTETGDLYDPGVATKTVRGVPAGAEPKRPIAAKTTFRDANGNVQAGDLRVKIRVPREYISGVSTRGGSNELLDLGGIIFPYTPSISYEHKADYTSSIPLHSNFAIYSYKNSSVSSISITGKFTVQNEKDAMVYLATVHLLRALTKMKSGGESNSGAPPPVCRLDGYGDYMLANVPIAISSFKNDLPDNVDFFTLGKSSTNIYGLASVPTISTISLTCIPIYSRREMQQFKVSDWLASATNRTRGYL